MSNPGRSAAATAAVLCALLVAGCGSEEELAGTSADSRMEGLRVELPCLAAGTEPVNCLVPDADEDSSRLDGEEGEVYSVAIRLRGLVEQKTYTDWESRDGMWIEGGTPDGSTFNVFRLHVSSPEKIYYLNAGASYIDECFVVDIEKTVVMDSGAVLTLLADAGSDGLATRNRDFNGDPIVVPGVPPYPEPFDGQFVQIDIVSISLNE